VLLIVIRDRTKTPHEKICSDMRRDLDTIWASLVKPPEYVDSSLDAFFELQYVTLPSFELEEEDFRAECTLLRRRFLPEGTNTFLRDDPSKVRSTRAAGHSHRLDCWLRVRGTISRRWHWGTHAGHASCPHTSGHARCPLTHLVMHAVLSRIWSRTLFSDVRLSCRYLRVRCRYI
jgi:hypothetical protein